MRRAAQELALAVPPVSDTEAPAPEGSARGTELGGAAGAGSDPVREGIFPITSASTSLTS